MEQPFDSVLDQDIEAIITKLLYALATCNAGICEAIIAHLRAQFALSDVAALLLVCLERLLWLDGAAFVWAVEHLIVTELGQEVRRLMSVTLGQQLLAQGWQPGLDFSLDALGRLLLSDAARAVAFKH